MELVFLGTPHILYMYKKSLGLPITNMRIDQTTKPLRGNERYDITFSWMKKESLQKAIDKAYHIIAYMQKANETTLQTYKVPTHLDQTKNNFTTP